MAPLLHSTTFNVCTDNQAAATSFAKKLRQQGYAAEPLEVHEAAVAHNAEQGNPSPPAAVAHDAPADVAIALSIEVEAAYTAVDESAPKGKAKAKDDK